MKLIQVTDVHLVPDGQLLFGADPVARLQACIDDINRHHADAALCVITGDLTHNGDEASYRLLADCLATLRTPWRLLLGNHDLRASFRRVFPDAPVDDNGFVQSVMEVPGAVLVFLDTLQEGTHEGRLCARRLAWLAQQLDAARDRDVYVFSHHPAPELGLASVDWIRLHDHEPLRALLTRHGRVRHLFSGHVHRPSAGTWHGIPFTTLRGTNHQHELDFALAGPATTVQEPPAYAVALLRDSGLVVHFHDFMDTSARYPYGA